MLHPSHNCTDRKIDVDAVGVPAFIGAVANDGIVILEANAAFAAAVGRPSDEKHGRRLRVLGGADAAAGLRRAAATCVADGVTVRHDVRIDASAGPVRWRLNLRPLVDGSAEFVATCVDLTDEGALRKARGWLDAIFDNANTGIIVIDVTTLQIVAANRVVEAMFGFGPGEVVGQSYKGLVTPSDLPDIDARQRASLAGVFDSYRAERHYRRKDGTILVAEIGGVGFWDAEADRPMWIGTIHDLTPMRRAERNLRDALDAITDGFALIDSGGRVQLCNEPFARFYGRPPAALAGLAVDDLLELGRGAGYLPVEYEDNMRRWWQSGQETGQGDFTEFSTTDGRWFLLRRHVTSDHGVVLVRTDVTEIKRREREIADTAALLRNGVRMARLGYWIWDEVADRCVYASEEMARLAGIPVAEFLDRMRSLDAYAALVHPDDRAAFLQATAAAAAQGEPYTIQYRIQREDGVVLHVVENAEFDHDAGGRPVRSIGTVQDITEHKRREVELEEARERLERQARDLIELATDYDKARQAAEDAKLVAEMANRAKSSFLANMSHELRTPLNAIIGFSEMMHRELLGPVGPPAYVEYAGDILASGRHLLGLINGLLDLSRIEAGRYELDNRRIDLAAVAQTSLRLVRGIAEQRRISLHLEAGSSVAVLADERAIEQILVNLVGNALKFSNDDGRVVVRVELSPEGTPILEVEDNGVGIPGNDIDRVLKPFEQARNAIVADSASSGLGLAIVDAFVRLHDGRLTIESEVNVGTRVTIRFPAYRHLATATEQGELRLPI